MAAKAAAGLRVYKQNTNGTHTPQPGKPDVDFPYGML
jgi:hypothetical protein